MFHVWYATYHMHLWCSKFTSFFSERGIFKTIQDEFKMQLTTVKDHYYQSDETKFNAQYVKERLKDLHDVRISRRQCCEHLSRIHNLIIPSTRALIKFKCRQRRVEVSRGDSMISDFTDRRLLSARNYVVSIEGSSKLWNHVSKVRRLLVRRNIIYYL